ACDRAGGAAPATQILRVDERGQGGAGRSSQAISPSRTDAGATRNQTETFTRAIKVMRGSDRDNEKRRRRFSKPHLWLIRVVGVIVPRRLRADWRQEWEAELRYRETLLAEWDKLDWRNKFDLLQRSLGAFRDALLLQPRRLEDEMFQDFRYGV